MAERRHAILVMHDCDRQGNKMYEIRYEPIEERQKCNAENKEII